MKLWERVIEHRLRRVTSVTQNQFGFMPRRSTMDAIFLIRQLMERLAYPNLLGKKGYVVVVVDN